MKLHLLLLPATATAFAPMMPLKPSRISGFRKLEAVDPTLWIGGGVAGAAVVGAVNLLGSSSTSEEGKG